MPLNSLPEPLHIWVSKAYHDNPGHWDKNNKEQRKRQIDDYDCEHNPARKVERAASWLIYTMDASAWWLAESISPLNAAMLLSCRNPNTETVEVAETNSSEEMGPQDFRRLRNIFEGASKDVTRTLKDWTEYARQRGLKIHSWIGEWEAWVSEVDALQAAPDVTESASGGMKTAKAWPVVKKETAIARNARRYQMCIDAGLTMPDTTWPNLPDGVGQVAKQENISTQAFSKSVKAHIATLQS